MLQRPTLPRKIQEEIMYNSAFYCAICPTKGDNIHHIDKNNANNNPDNLILLCQAHHDEAHTTRELSLNLTPERLKKLRKKWYSNVQLSRTKAASAHNQSHPDDSYRTNAIWAYINHSRLIQTTPKELITNANPALLTRLKSAGVIDENGILIKPDEFTPSDTYLRNTIYDYYEYSDRFALHMFYSNLVDLFVEKNKIIHLDEINWNRTFVKQMIIPGSLIFINKAQYFKKTHEGTENAEVDVHTFKRKLSIKYQVNTRNMFGTTSITCSFSGHRSCASLLQVKSIEDIGSKRIIHCTPFALGVGFDIKTSELLSHSL